MLLAVQLINRNTERETVNQNHMRSSWWIICKSLFRIRNQHRWIFKAIGITFEETQEMIGRLASDQFMARLKIIKWNDLGLLFGMKCDHLSLHFYIIIMTRLEWDLLRWRREMMMRGGACNPESKTENRESLCKFRRGSQKEIQNTLQKKSKTAMRTRILLLSLNCYVRK